MTREKAVCITRAKRLLIVHRGEKLNNKVSELRPRGKERQPIEKLRTVGDTSGVPLNPAKAA